MPTLYHDLIHNDRFAAADVTSVRKLGFAGASMTDGLLKELNAAFKPELFVNHYGSSEIYTFTIDQNAPAKPGSAGRAGINQRIRVVKLNAVSHDEVAAIGEEGEIIALLASDEAFEGYWRRPEADAKALRQGWYFTGDTGYIDADGDLFVTGRVDDMIITGGENVSPVEIESCLSLHPAVSEVAVVGLPDERWGKIVAAFIKRRGPVEEDELDQFCRTSGLANFKRPRRYVFVAEIPKSPVGKLLRRKLVAGEFEAEGKTRLTRNSRMTAMTFDDPRLAALDGFTVELTPEKQRADIILHRPPLNVIEMPQRDQLRLVFEALDEDERVRVIVLRAIGEHFSSGGNIKGFMEASPEHVSKLAWNIAAPARCSKPVIVANRGYCFGVGFEISLACDFRIVSETCFYALPEQKLGQIPGSGGSARLQKIVGITRTKDIVMRSKRIPGKQALDWGIATECVPDAKLEAATDALVDELLKLFAARAAHRQEAAQRHRGLRRCRSPSSWKGIATAGCGNPTISAKAWRPSTASGRRNSKALESPMQGRPSAADNDVKGRNDMKHYRMTIMAALLAATAMSAAYAADAIKIGVVHAADRHLCRHRPAGEMGPRSRRPRKSTPRAASWAARSN